MVALIKKASWVVKCVMVLLVLMSLAGWYIIVVKSVQIRRSDAESRMFLEAFWQSRDIEQIYKQAQGLKASPISKLFRAGYSELAKLTSDDRQVRDSEADLDNIKRALQRAETTEVTKLETMVPFLATTGSSAPFIGLFGTVWGIMNSFLAIDPKKGANIGTVAPGLAEALFATAIGLVAAIPAVMAYNYFQRKIRVQVSEMRTFQQDYLNIIRRHFLT